MITEAPFEQQWTLQGRLCGQWAADLKAMWEETRSARAGRKCTVNLEDVTSVDQTGETALLRNGDGGRTAHRQPRLHEIHPGRPEMWIIKVALNRPYTFIVLSLLILIIAPVVIFRTPTDIFPNIDIPVISVAWTYTGLNPEELEGRLTTPYEKALTTLVDNIEHLESTTYNGAVVVKMFLQPNASLTTANAQVTAASQFLLRQLPPGTQPPQIINFSASSVPILQLGISGKGLAEDALNDLSLNFLRPQLVTVPGRRGPLPLWRQAAADHDQHERRPVAIERAFTAGPVECGKSTEPGLAFRHGQDRAHGIRRAAE